MKFNLQLLSFMDYDTSKDFYSLNYFEATWFPLNNDDEVKYDFILWSYFGKFNFKGNKKQLINKNNLKEYIYFTNNCFESFNHCINQCLHNNSKVRFNKLKKY
jgi:hypothetical protein